MGKDEIQFTGNQLILGQRNGSSLTETAGSGVPSALLRGA